MGSRAPAKEQTVWLLPYVVVGPGIEAKASAMSLVGAGGSPSPIGRLLPGSKAAAPGRHS